MNVPRKGMEGHVVLSTRAIPVMRDMHVRCIMQLLMWGPGLKVPVTRSQHDAIHPDLHGHYFAPTVLLNARM
jgi:hypothetical protein